MTNIQWDITSFDAKVRQMLPQIEDAASKGVGEAADELLRLSSKEVPFDTGHLQSTGAVTKGKLEAAVSYDTPYAVRVHEHPEYRFQHGRKGKYLEDPMKNNVGVFNKIITKNMQEAFD
jgi:hypothetical protein